MEQHVMWGYGLWPVVVINSLIFFFFFFSFTRPRSLTAWWSFGFAGIFHLIGRRRQPLHTASTYKCQMQVNQFGEIGQQILLSIV